MKTSQVLEIEPISEEEQLRGINAKTAPYPAARSWSEKEEKEDARHSVPVMTCLCVPD